MAEKEVKEMTQPLSAASLAVLEKCRRYFNGDGHVYPNTGELVEKLLRIVEMQRQALVKVSDRNCEPCCLYSEEALTATDEMLKELGK